MEENQKKNSGIKQLIIGIVIVVIIVAVVVVGIFIFQKKKQEEKRLLEEQERLGQPAYFTEHMLSQSDFVEFAEYFWVDTNPHWMLEPNTEHWPDFSYYTMEPSERTALVVEILNCVPHNYSDELIAKLEESGHSEGELYTVEWVMENPLLALQCIKNTAETKENEDLYRLQGEYSIGIFSH